MINYYTTLKDELASIGQPVYYELAAKSVSLPCITYIESNNNTTISGDTIEYGEIGYLIKIWDNQIARMQETALLVDSKMRQLGFTRSSSYDLADPNSQTIQKIINYTAQYKEEI